jgi:hypothetical protein
MAADLFDPLGTHQRLQVEGLCRRSYGYELFQNQNP